MNKEKREEFDSDQLLEDLFTEHKHYFVDDRYRKPTSRYEAWLMASYLSNMKIAKVLQDAFSELKTILADGNIFQKQVEKPIIKGENNKDQTGVLKRRRRE